MSFNDAAPNRAEEPNNRKGKWHHVFCFNDAAPNRAEEHLNDWL